VSEYDHDASIIRRSWPTGAFGPWGIKKNIQGVATECDGFQIAILINWIEYKKK
jgi:hypothetical protein